MLDTPFSPWPAYSEDEVAAAAAVLRSGRVNYWTGDRCRQFEKQFADWVGCKYAVALANGTVALDVALKALAVRPGDEVITTPRTFVASASAIVNAGATPIFADVDLDSQNITAESISQVLSDRTKAIICVHLGGMPCDMDPIMALAGRAGVKVIEDCAQAHGAKYKGRMVGSIGHVGAWSFCQDKIMTTAGEGGMVTTNDRALWSAMWSYKDHGKSWDAVYVQEHPPGPRMVHHSIGTNWRMIEIQAAIGLIQLGKMESWHNRRAAIASQLTTTCAAHPALRVPRLAPDCTHAWYRFYTFVRPNLLKTDWDRDRIIQEINARGVPCLHGSASEVYLEQAFRRAGFGPEARLPHARHLGETSLAFLVHPTLTDAEVAATCAAINGVMSEASGM